MRKPAFALALVLGACCQPSPWAQTTPPTAVKAPPELSAPLVPLHFLEGTWQANATGANARSLGTYTFAPDLQGHVLARHGVTAHCTGTADFDCQHGDLLYVFPEGAGDGLKALYLDSEGHVIHYAVTMPDSQTAVFLSEGAGPAFRLTYSLKGGIMSGRFEVQLPGQTEWHPYLQWTGSKVP